MKTYKPHLIPTIFSVVMLLLALADWPYGYYTLLRFVVCGSAAFVAYLGYSAKKRWIAWTFGIIAVLFNPIIKVHFDRDIWSFLDIIVAIVFVFTFFKLTGMPKWK